MFQKPQFSASSPNFPAFYQKMKKTLNKNDKWQKSTQAQDVVGGKTRFDAQINVLT
jgi:hypothetical protein